MHAMVLVLENFQPVLVSKVLETYQPTFTQNTNMHTYSVLILIGISPPLLKMLSYLWCALI